MEVCVPYTPAAQDKSNDGGSDADPWRRDYCNLRDLSVNALETCLSEFLNIEDNKPSTSSFYQFADKNGTCHVVREGKQDGFDKKNSYGSASEKCLSKSDTFPLPGEPKSSVDGLLVGLGKQGDVITVEVSEPNGCGKFVNYSQSILLPIVSAMKGSREKQGIEPKKLSVTWAPGVYDPVPTAASRVPSNKNQRYRNDGKSYGKNKLKGGGKSSRGRRGKDKKQVHKNNGGNNVKPIRDNRLLGFGKPVTGIEILMSRVHTPSVELVF
ncbi:uncharacterized protein [Primulina huaijiensis]|uniref:uncharacterized protein isoform X2 n=1 Tax=Primulina huaijiensis TaxID=1492673 RepID=UPI003CC6E2E7